MMEILQIQNRGKYFLYMTQAFPLGELIVVIIAWMTFDDLGKAIYNCLEHGNWRLLLFYAFIPTVICIVV